MQGPFSAHRLSSVGVYVMCDPRHFFQRGPRTPHGSCRVTEADWKNAPNLGTRAGVGGCDCVSGEGRPGGNESDSEEAGEEEMRGEKPTKERESRKGRLLGGVGRGWQEEEGTEEKRGGDAGGREMGPRGEHSEWKGSVPAGEMAPEERADVCDLAQGEASES